MNKYPGSPSFRAEPPRSPCRTTSQSCPATWTPTMCSFTHLVPASFLSISRSHPLSVPPRVPWQTALLSLKLPTQSLLFWKYLDLRPALRWPRTPLPPHPQPSQQEGKSSELERVPSPLKDMSWDFHWIPQFTPLPLSGTYIASLVSKGHWEI